MRLELAGSLVKPEPLIIPFVANGTFDPTEYIPQGYTNFDVICIGGGGGTGGGIDTANTGTQVRNFGGGGGGGGLHRVQGLLTALPASCPVVVGAGGAVGVEHASDPALTTDGADGGYSSFNGTTCQASGGKGGKRAQSNSQTVTTQANGGVGGAGNRLIAGGGGLGGVAGTPTATGPGTPGTAGADGTWNGTIGLGGGGGAGGVGKYGSGGTMLNAATAGGRGSYDVSDTSVYVPGTDPSNDPVSGSPLTMPGGAGGGKAAPLTSLPTPYGQSQGKRLPGLPGIVMLRLTAA
jgi:hypothetical protein